MNSPAQPDDPVAANRSRDSDADDSNRSFSSDDPEARQVGEYRTLSTLAILTLAGGLLSVLAIFAPLLWALPAATLALGVAALRSLASTPQKMGRRAAVVGIGLALFFGSWAPARYVSRQVVLYGYARQFADEWLALVRQGKFYQAHQLQLYTIQRAGADVPLEKYYQKSENAREAFGSFFGTEPVKTMRKLRDRATYRFVQNEAYAPETTRDTIALRYEMSYTADGKLQRQPILILLLRAEELANQSGYDWQIEHVVSPADPGAL